MSDWVTGGCCGWQHIYDSKLKGILFLRCPRCGLALQCPKQPSLIPATCPNCDLGMWVPIEVHCLEEVAGSPSNNGTSRIIRPG